MFLAIRIGFSGQNPQQAVRQIVQIMQPVAHIGVLCLTQTGPGKRLLFLDSGLGGQPVRDVGFHPAHPTARIGKHPVSLKDFDLIGGHCAVAAEQFVDGQAQRFHRSAQAFQL